MAYEHARHVTEQDDTLAYEDLFSTPDTLNFGNFQEDLFTEYLRATTSLSEILQNKMIIKLTISHAVAIL